MRKERMTIEEYEEARRELAAIDEKIKELKTQRKKIFDRVRWYEYTAERTPRDYNDGFCVQTFGKRKKDLTEEEAREYKRIQTAKSREKQKKNQ